MGSRFPAGPQPPTDDPAEVPLLVPSPVLDSASETSPGPDLAETDRIRRRRPRGLLLLTRCRIGVGRWSRASRRAVRALAAEQEGHPGQHDSVHATHGEDALHSIARRRAGHELYAAFRRLSRMNRRADRLKARRATLLDRIRRIPDEHVAHPDGIPRTLRQTEADRDALAARVERERSQNSHKHDRLARWFRLLPRVVLVFDFLLLIYFLSGITDVNWAAPQSPQLAFAAALAAMITVISYGCFAFAGDRLRAHKDHAGRIPLASLDWLTRVVVAACALGMVVLGLLMFSRMWSEVLLALGNGARETALSVAAAVTAVSILANLMVIAVHARDGSEQTDRLSAFGQATRRPLARRDRMLRRVIRLEHRIETRARAAQRVEANGRARSMRPPMLADEAVKVARATHQQAGHLSEATIAGLGRRAGAPHHPDPVTTAAERALRLASSQMETDLRPGHPLDNGASGLVPGPRPAPEP